MVCLAPNVRMHITIGMNGTFVEEGHFEVGMAVSF